MSENLNKWVAEHEEELKLVAEHGRTKTVRAQAKAFLEIVGKEEELEEVEV